VRDETQIKVAQKVLDYLDEFYKHITFNETLTSLKLTSSFKSDIKTEIDNLFEILKTDVISSSKLFARMQLMYSSEMTSLMNFNNKDDFYYLVSLLFRKFYYFKEPFISKNENTQLTNDEIITSYAYTLNTINIKKINDYADKMHLKRIDNYLSFIIDCSSEYVQVNIDELVRKELFIISSHILDIIKKEMIYYINSYGEINSDSYNGYINLPELPYNWNIYLAVGIIRTYLFEYFEIHYTGSVYKRTKFIIKKR
jgi:hypothetical protein